MPKAKGIAKAGASGMKDVEEALKRRPGRAGRGWALLYFASLASGALPCAAQQVYPGYDGEPPHMDVSCACSSDVPPPGRYLLANNVAWSRGVTIPTGDGYPTRVDVGDCGESLELTTGFETVTLTRQSLGQTPVYRGPYDTNDGVRGTMTLVTAERDGLPFEPPVRLVLRGEAEAGGVRFPLVLQLQSTDPDAFEACECALMGRYYERIEQYRQIFLDRALMDEARRRNLELGEFQTFMNEVRTRRRDAFDRSLGRTAADDPPGGGGSTTSGGFIHIDDLEMLDRGVPPEMIESVHVHEEVHQARRRAGVPRETNEQYAADEVAASDAQLAYLESWLRANCPRWSPPTRVFE